MLILAAALTAAACGGSVADNPAPATAEAAEGTPAAPAPAAPRYREVTVPAGTTLRLELKTAVNSATSHVEDVVRAELRQAVAVNGATVLPAGAELAGVVTDAERSGRVKGRARVAYRFDSLRMNKERYDIKTASVSHLAPATKSEDATKIAIGAGAGAALGAILGGGDGAAKGAAIGGAGGTGAVLATRGKEVGLAPGAEVNTELTAPLTVRIRIN
jgi:hypothetical protein